MLILVGVLSKRAYKKKMPAAKISDSEKVDFLIMFRV